MKKKVIALVLTVAMATVTLTGCGQKAETPATEVTEEVATTEEAPEQEVTVEDVTLTVWGPQEDQAASDAYSNGLLAAMCEEFNAQHPEWNITFQYGVCGEDVAKDEVTKDVSAAADVYM